MREHDLFTIIQRYLAPDLVKTYEDYDRIDAITDQWHTHIEIKCRRRHYPDLLLEKKKYDAMLARAEACGGYDPVYICSTPAGAFWSYRLLHLPAFDWDRRLMPKSTDFAPGGKKEMIWKDVIMLPLSWASRAYHLPAPGDTALRPFDAGSQAAA
jgi:hypothetical protein